jgi:hypothetical protein
MPDFVRLQVLPGAPVPLIGLHSSGAQVGDVSVQPLPLPALPPIDAASLRAALPLPIRIALAQLARVHGAAPLTLWLDLQVSAVAAWPWELLSADDGAPPFACTPELPLARAFPALAAPKPRGTGPLHLLVCSATPHTAQPFDATRLRQQLRDLAAAHQQSIHLELLEHTSATTLRASLAQADVDVIVFLTHGRPGELVLEDAQGDAEPVTSGDLALLLRRIPAVVLASCDSASFAPGGDTLATALLRAGVSGVVAMNGAMPFEAAAAFLPALLASLSSGEALEVAAARGRQQIVAQYGSAAGDCVLPVCYQRTPGRPLIQLALTRGVQQLTTRAATPKVSELLTTGAAGGALGLLAVFALQPLLAPLLAAGATGAVLSAATGLLADLGLDVFAGYFGAALGEQWRRAGKPPAGDEVAQLLRDVAVQHADAAAQLAALSHDSGALRQTVDQINRGVTGHEVLLRGLGLDLARHGAALDTMRDDLRAGLAPIYREMLGLREDVRTVAVGVAQVRDISAETRAGVQDLRERLDADEQARRAREQALLDAYLDALLLQYQPVSLSRFVELKKGSGESVVRQLYLEDVFVALTTGHAVRLPTRRSSYSARTVSRALRMVERRSAEHVPPHVVRTLQYLPVQEGPGEDDEAARIWLATALDIADRHERQGRAGLEKLPPDTLLAVQLMRPELVVEAIAPRASGMQPRVILLGDPGSGKSTALRYTTILLAQALRGLRPLDLTGWRAPRLPLLAPLGTLAKHFAAGGDDTAALRVLIAETLEGGGARPRAGLAALLPRLWSEAILMLDGLDELSGAPGSGNTPSPRERAAVAIRALARELPDTPIVVTSRVLPYRAPAGEAWRLPDGERWREREVRPFAFGQVRHFVSRWYEASLTTPEAAPARAAALIAELEANPALRQAIAPAGLGAEREPPASPLLLTMLTILHYNRDGRPLPPERDELYEKLVDLLLHRWEPRRSDPVYEREDLLRRLNIAGLKGSTEPLRRVLHEIAFKAHESAQRGGDGRGVIDGDTLTGRLGRYFRETLECSPAEVDEKVAIFLDVLRDDAGLLSRLGDNTYVFPHLTFQEYLAGCYLADRESPADAAYERWRGADADRWREALLLMSGRLRQTNSAAREGVRWLKRLARERFPLGDELRPKEAAQRQRDALLAADCYEVLGRRTRIDREQWEEVEALLQASFVAALPAARDQATYLLPRERNRLGLALAQLGDPRPGVCTLPAGLDDPYWAAPIPAGTYPIADGQARVRLNAFRVARYPVTVWQYRQFVDAGGYQDEQWWTPEGKQRRKQLWPPHRWGNPDWTADNQPVVGVSWYEAMAFCTWLNALTTLPAGWRIRLPSEAEWEVAATWDAAARATRAWAPPEGELWQNVAEAEIGRTSVVGLFPQGASPCGALDMAGNVWEWCSSSYEGYPEQAAELRDNFTTGDYDVPLRGGAYYLQNARSGWGARDWDDPYDLDLVWGFRVVV